MIEKTHLRTENTRAGTCGLIVFFGIVILISAVVETMICQDGPEWLYFVLMWIPAFAAAVANCISFRENREPFSLRKLLARGGFRKCKIRYVLLGCLLPLVYLLISSLFWCCWHLPLLISGDYMSGTPLWYQLPAFVLCIFPVGVMAGLLTLESGSVWPAAFLHAVHNNYDQMVFQVITAGDSKMYFVSETGVLTILCAWILAAIMYLRARKQAKHL